MQKVISPIASSSQPRILILSMRNLESYVSRSYINELKKCIFSWENVDLLSIPYFRNKLSKK